MPELPEIESLRRSLRPLVGGSITAVSVRRDDVVFPAGARPLRSGAAVTACHRHGKQLVLETDRHGCLLVHLGMSGSLRLVGAREAVETDRHMHVEWAFTLADRSRVRLIHRDPRRFGWLEMLPDMEHVRALWRRTLGPDALDLDPAAFGCMLARTARPVKAALLDQALVAGVGNIYADESLFRAGVHPFRRSDRLRPVEIGRLCRAVRSVLSKAVDLGGSTIRDHRTVDGGWGSYQRLHRVYGRGGQPCRRCRTVLVNRKLQQRSTVFCPACQPRKGSVVGHGHE